MSNFINPSGNMQLPFSNRPFFPSNIGYNTPSLQLLSLSCQNNPQSLFLNQIGRNLSFSQQAFFQPSIGMFRAELPQVDFQKDSLNTSLHTFSKIEQKPSPQNDLISKTSTDASLEEEGKSSLEECSDVLCSQEKSSEGKKRKTTFTSADDLKILRLYETHKTDWEKIASEFNAKTAQMIKNRFYFLRRNNSFLKDKTAETCNTFESSTEEESSVNDFHKQKSSLSEDQTNSSGISTQVSPGLSETDEAKQTPELLKASKKISRVVSKAQKEWKSEYDTLLIQRTDQYKRHWKKISKKFKTEGIKATPAFLKNQFSKLKGDKYLLHVPFTAEEDEKLVKLQKIHGLKWDLLAKFFDNRTKEMLKNRYYRHLKKKDCPTEAAEFAVSKNDASLIQVESKEVNSIQMETSKQSENLKIEELLNESSVRESVTINPCQPNYLANQNSIFNLSAKTLPSQGLIQSHANLPFFLLNNIQSYNLIADLRKAQQIQSMKSLLTVNY